MEEAEGVLSFDFEGGLDAIPMNSNHSMSSINLDSSSAAVIAGGSSLPGTASDPYAINVAGRRSFRQTVCRHWLRGLCMKGEACGFLHQYDKSRMPICRFFRLFGECREQDCVYKHSNEDIKECNMYKLGFCPNGPDCRYRHAKLHGPPPTVEEAIQKIQSLVSFSYNANNRFLPNRNSGLVQPSEKSQFPQRVIGADQNSLPKLSTTELTNEQQQESQQAMQSIGKTQTQIISNCQLQESRMAFPLPQGESRYFIVKSCNRENLELSVQQGVWATQRSNEAKLNEAFDCVDNVILIFSINRTRHFQGCAKMTSKIGGYVGGGNWKYAHGTAHYGRNFRVKWCKLCELSFIKTRHLRNPYNENLPVKISRDCQEIEPSIGEQLAALLYLEPDSDLMGIARAAESKRDEEKEKGVDESNERGDPDIVPFEDNEEEEEEETEEEEEEEDEAAGILMGAGILGRGRGLLWPLQMQLPTGTRPGIHGYPYDTFPPLLPDQYVSPASAAAPRHFGAYVQPRLLGAADLASAAAGVMFQGRPAQGASVFPPSRFGMMLAPVRPAPFIGAMAPARVGPVFPPFQFLQQPPQGGGWGGRRDPPPGWNSDGAAEKDGGGEEVQDGVLEDRHEDSETEDDEAPRRSRHVDVKRKR